MKIYLDASRPASLSKNPSIDEIIIALSLGGHHADVAKIVQARLPMYQEIENVGSGKCACYCGCGYHFSEEDCCHDIRGNFVCDKCFLGCYMLTIVFA